MNLHSMTLGTHPRIDDRAGLGERIVAIGAMAVGAAGVGYLAVTACAAGALVWMLP